MGSRAVPDEKLRAAGEAVQRLGNRTAAAADLGIAEVTLRRWLREAKERDLGLAPIGTSKPFTIDELPSDLPTIDELRAARRAEWSRVNDAKSARKLIPVQIKIDGPIGICHFGDPHIDDPGTNFPLLEKHIDIVNRTEGLFGANVGDLQNNWIGRLARLYADQATTARASWALTEWLVRSVQWLYLIAGNHDLWAGAGDPVHWMMRAQTGPYEAHGARLNLLFPDGKQVRVNARHDFSGHSMWNTAHGPAKAVQMGWRDHVLTCGHKHTSGYNVLKDPASGLISHAIRVASYKHHDRYADEKGLPDQNIFEAPVTIIDPNVTDEKRLVTVIFDPEEAAEFLTWKRSRWKSGKR